MREIKGLAKTIRHLLSKTKYAIDYYQREFKWKTKHVVELIQDLSVEFLENYEESHERKDVAEYGHYFLGSVIVSDKKGKKYIVDGQQRLTTLTLLIIFLNNIQKDRNKKDQVAVTDMIFSQQYGQNSFNLDVPERKKCMSALFDEKPFDENKKSESVKNIKKRYTDIVEHFPEELKGKALPYFIDWLIDNVYLVEITAYSDEDAYTIFETMNDRGLSLSPTDMLKGYLLANISGEEKRWEIHEIWKENIVSLAAINSDETSDFFKAWLRSRYAKSIRERKRGAKPGDFDRIGTEFHRWVREKREALGLNRSDDFVRFIDHDLVFYARQYRTIREASLAKKENLEELYFLAQYGFTLQYPLLLAPLKLNDSPEEITKKLRIVASFLDILLTRRLWNWRSISYSTLQYAMFRVMVDIRGKSAVELTPLLIARLAEEGENFHTNERFALHGQNRVHIHRLLARLMDFVEKEAELPSHYEEYMGGTGSNRYEVEHIWSDHPEWHTDEFDHPADFDVYRNHIGGLLLLPKTFNASYGDLPYKEKLDHYYGQNLLAKSLHPRCYKHEPGFLSFIDRAKLPFKPHDEYKQADLEERQYLYMQMAEMVWNPKRLEDILND